jgi:hypothetical protein
VVFRGRIFFLSSTFPVDHNHSVHSLKMST